MKMRGKRLQCGSLDRLGLGGACAFVLGKAKAIQLSNKFTLDRHFACVIYFGHNGLLLAQPAQQNRGAPVYKSFRQRVMQRIRQSVFYMARRIAPMAKIGCPPLPLGDICPRADKGQPF